MNVIFIFQDDNLRDAAEVMMRRVLLSFKKSDILPVSKNLLKRKLEPCLD